MCELFAGLTNLNWFKLKDTLSNFSNLLFLLSKLARSFEQLALKEKERSKDLKKAQKYCDQVSIDLLSIAATTNNAGEVFLPRPKFWI